MQFASEKKCQPLSSMTSSEQCTMWWSLSASSAPVKLWRYKGLFCKIHHQIIRSDLDHRRWIKEERESKRWGKPDGRRRRRTRSSFLVLQIWERGAMKMKEKGRKKNGVVSDAGNGYAHPLTRPNFKWILIISIQYGQVY